MIRVCLRLKGEDRNTYKSVDLLKFLSHECPLDPTFTHINTPYDFEIIDYCVKCRKINEGITDINFLCECQEDPEDCEKTITDFLDDLQKKIEFDYKIVHHDNEIFELCKTPDYENWNQTETYVSLEIASGNKNINKNFYDVDDKDIERLTAEVMMEKLKSN